MELGLIEHFLPAGMLDYFEVKSITKLGDISTKQLTLEIALEERNVLPKGYSQADYESKGFSSTKRVQDFPIRGKAVYLNITRRRWRHKQTKKQVTSDYSFIAQGSKLTEEISDFLKGTGRDPSRYH